jgi:diaminopimelate decarboxylase
VDYKLPPIIHSDVKALLDDRSTDLYSLVDLLGSPLHIVMSEVMQETIRQFRKVLDTHEMQGGTINFAAKANKANTFLVASAAAGICVDVSSAQEFSAALSAGVPGYNISVSGPAKPPALLALAILHDACISVDEPAELDSIIELLDNMPAVRPVRLYLRLSTGDKSRFGMTTEVMSQVITHIIEVRDKINLEGFSFHASSYATDDRVYMIGEVCKALKSAHDRGLSPTRINIGGGLTTKYAKDSEWSLEHATDREFVGGVKPQFVYPYTAEPSGYSQLDQILELSKPVLAATEKVIGSKIMIDIEPGRSLLDQAGITVFRVRGVRPIGKRWLVMVDGNSRSLSEFWRNSEFFIDPIMITSSERAEKTFSAAIASNTCLESDYLARRFIPFKTRPQTGDLLVFINTAGYQMDSKESEFHRLPLPSKVAALKKVTGWRYINDNIISVADLLITRKEA